MLGHIVACAVGALLGAVVMRAMLRPRLRPRLSGTSHSLGGYDVYTISEGLEHERRQNAALDADFGGPVTAPLPAIAAGVAFVPMWINQPLPAEIS